MAIDTAPTRNRAQPPNLRVLEASSGVRADAERVVQVVTDALAPWLEIIAIADDVIAAAERIAMAAAAGSRAAVVNEANRLAFRVSGCRAEARERVADIDRPRGAA